MAIKNFKLYPTKPFMLFAFGLFVLNISWTNPNYKASPASSDTTSVTLKAISFEHYVNTVYYQMELNNSGLNFSVFEKAITGYINLKNKQALNQSKDIVTIVDFTKPSTEKRMWIVDMASKKLMLHTFVAHGQGSGDNMATSFSNVVESHQSSLGFYIASETYFGKHGLSLKLDGQDKGVNDLARERAIVVHGAKYVSESYIKNTGRLGRSFGCPAVSEALNAKVINLIKDKTCFFINGNSQNYNSSLLATVDFDKNPNMLASL